MTTTELQAQQDCGWIKDIHYASAFEKLDTGLRTNCDILYCNSPNRKLPCFVISKYSV